MILFCLCLLIWVCVYVFYLLLSLCGICLFCGLFVFAIVLVYLLAFACCWLRGWLYLIVGLMDSCFVLTIVLRCWVFALGLSLFNSVVTICFYLLFYLAWCSCWFCLWFMFADYFVSLLRCGLGWYCVWSGLCVLLVGDFCKVVYLACFSFGFYLLINLDCCLSFTLLGCCGLVVWLVCVSLSSC